jgi:hypothetical protein
MDNNKELSDNINKTILFAMKEIQGASGWSMDRNRPYDGQIQTDSGERGKALIVGLTMRDMVDCMVRGYLAAAGVKRDNPVWDDVFSIDLPHFDPMAMMQNAMREVEKMMGIYPNVPPLIEKETGNPNDTQK